MKNIQIKILQLILLLAMLMPGIDLMAQQLKEVTDSLTTSRNQKINIGYGQQSCEKLIESVSSISSSVLTKSTVNTTGNALFGRLPGLIVRQSNSEPGNDAPSLRIRGTSTYSNSEPVILIDGFEADFSKISLSEIESISVMKDAAATAIYGLKGANGVILVTTKRGKEGKTQFEVNIQSGLTNVMQSPKLLDSYNYASLYNKALSMDGLSPLYNADLYPGGATPGDPLLNTNNNWQNQLIRNSAPMHNASIQLSGGTSGLKYYLNLNYLRSEGHYKYTDVNDGYSTQSQFDRVNIRTNMDIDLVKNLAIDVDLGIRFEDRNSPGSSSDAIWNSIYQTPGLLYNMINPDGSIGGTTDYRNNPYALINATGYQGNHTRDVNATMRSRYDFSFLTEGLSAGAAFSVFDQSYTIDNKIRQFAVFAINKDFTYLKFGDNTNLEWQSGSSYYRRNNFEADLSYKRTFGDHTIDAITLFKMNRLIRQSTHHKASNMGISGRVNYSFKERYLAEATWSYQGSELFHPDRQFGFFPAAALGWIVSKEKFITENVPFINYLKIRGSYGLSGSDLFVTGTGVDSRIFYNQYYGGLGGYNFGVDASNAKGGYGELRLANPMLSWEKSYKTDLSADISLFNCLDLAFSWFRDNRKDIFTLDANAPAVIGVNSSRLPYTNNGEVTNRGYETSVRFSDNAGDWSWSVCAALEHNRSEIIRKGDEPLYQEANRLRIGKPVGQNFGMVSTGLYDGTSAYLPQLWGSLVAGDLTYANMNGDNIIDDRDVTAIGYTGIPEFSYSFDLSLKYKNLDFSALIQGIDNVSTVLGGQFIPFRSKMNAFSNVFDAWTLENSATATLPRLTTLDSPNNHRSSTTWLASTRFIKLRNVELGYAVNMRFIEKIHLSSARLYVRGMNLFTWHNSFDLLDPEIMTGYPALRTLMAGIQVNF